MVGTTCTYKHNVGDKMNLETLCWGQNVPRNTLLWLEYTQKHNNVDEIYLKTMLGMKYS